MSFNLKMLFRTELLYLIILSIFFLGQSFAQEFSVSFSADVTGKNSWTTNCNFNIHFTDTEILATSKVKCQKCVQNCKRFMIIPSYKNEVEQTKHILRQAFKKNNVIKTSILKIFLIRPLFKRSFFDGLKNRN